MRSHDASMELATDPESSKSNEGRGKIEVTSWMSRKHDPG